MGLTFEVAEGGFLDIDVRIEGPDGRTVHSGKENLIYQVPSYRDFCSAAAAKFSSYCSRLGIQISFCTLNVPSKLSVATLPRQGYA